MTNEPISGASCRAARALLKWSVAELTKKAGVSPNTVAKLEREEASPSASRGRIIAAFARHGVEVLAPPADGARRIAAD